MCMNQILKNEQITLIRYSEATDQNVMAAQRRKLNLFGHILQAHPYVHRPYVHRGGCATPATAPPLPNLHDEGIR